MVVAEYDEKKAEYEKQRHSMLEALFPGVSCAVIIEMLIQLPKDVRV